MKISTDLYQFNVKDLLEFANEYLPTQGPLEYFVHHNTLHAYEEFNFYDALKNASSIYGAKTKKSLFWYQERYKEGRIQDEDLKRVLAVKTQGLDFDDKFVQELLFFNRHYRATTSNLKLEMFIKEVSSNLAQVPEKFREVNTFWDYIKKHHQKDKLINEVSWLRTKFFSAYFDKGVAYWNMENRELGLLESFIRYVDYLPNSGIRKVLKNEVHKLKALKGSSLEQRIEVLFRRFNVPSQFAHNLFVKILLKSKGWAALVKTLEQNDLNNPTKINSSLAEFTVIQMLFEVSCYEYLQAKQIVSEFDYKFVNLADHHLYYEYFFKHVGLKTQDYEKYLQLTEDLIFEIWHEAYEWNVIKKTVAVLDQHKEKPAASEVKLQVVMCIDDREESIRRHLEEYSEEIETFGYAGHFGLNMMFKGLHQAHFRALCPVSVRPEHFVWERPADINQEVSSKSKLGRIKQLFFYHSKTPIIGAFLALLLAPFALLMYFLDTLLPKQGHDFKQFIDKLFVSSEDDVVMEYEFNEENKLRGYTVEEMADVVFAMLKTIGLKDGFAPLIYICGHGSKNINNPHEAAYDCGACSGGKGFPNAKLFSTMGNREDVRKLIASKYQVQIPDTTKFVAGYHNTCNDDLLILEPNKLETEEYSYLNQVFTEVNKHDAKERVRKFENVSLNVSEEAALDHVQSRAINMSQPRPEYGHSTNTLCLVGTRQRSRDIFLDRRAFLVSYDQNKDENLDVLEALINSIVPVCAGINLEYYFSYVDREYFGSGVKQPHNVTSLMGVMTGYRSDLRLGLPWQMVEIHEPMRITIVLDSELEKFKSVMENCQSKNLIVNYWVRIIVATPDKKYYLYENDEFVLIDTSKYAHYIKEYSNNKAIYEGKTEIIDFALIE